MGENNMRNKIILTLGVGYLCMKLPNIKKVNIKDELNIKDVENEYKDIMLIITDKDVCKNIMIIRINDRKNNIKLLNIKDEIQIENKNIIETFVSKGIVRTINKINEKINISISQYIKDDYLALENLVNDMGGIKINLSKSDRKLLCLENNEEECILDGKKSINYMNLSNIKGSTKKSNRQKRLINSLIDQLTDRNPKEFVNMISPIIKFIETTMETKEIVSLGYSFMKIGTSNLYKSTIPSTKMLKKDEIVDSLYMYDIENYRNEVRMFLGI